MLWQLYRVHYVRTVFVMDPGSRMCSEIFLHPFFLSLMKGPQSQWFRILTRGL